MGRPHLIFLMTDQLRCDMLGPYGSEQCATPKLDILARRCTAFQRHFTTCPLSVPARGSIATGLHTHQHGAIISGWFEHERAYGAMRPDVPLLHRPLLDAGYRIVHAGVQHLRTQPELSRMFPEVEFVGPMSVGEHLKSLDARGLLYGNVGTFRDPVIDYDRHKPVVYSATSPRTGVFPLREELFFDQTLGRNIVETIERHADRHRETPLALFGMFWSPHAPLWAPQEWAQMYDPAQIRLPATVGRWMSGMPVMQLANIPGQLGAHVSEDQWRRAWAMYMGLVSMLDRVLGRVFAALDYAGMLDDALVIFTASHGEMLGSHSLFQKMCLYDEAVRVPLMVKLPGQTVSRRVKDLTSHVDLAATITEVCQAAPLRDTAGLSLAPLAAGEPAKVDHRSHVFAAYDGNAGRSFHHRMIRSRTHKLIHNIDDRTELYDLVDDPFETRNIAGMDEHRAIERPLRLRLNEWMDEVGDPQPRCATSPSGDDQ